MEIAVKASFRLANVNPPYQPDDFQLSKSSNIGLGLSRLGAEFMNYDFYLFNDLREEHAPNQVRADRNVGDDMS